MQFRAIPTFVMNYHQSKTLIKFLRDRWRISSAFDLDDLIEELESSVSIPFSYFNTFEFSLNSSEKMIRPLHLNFYKANLSLKIIDKLRIKRVNAIRRIAKGANQLPKRKWTYNKDIISHLYRLTRNTPWPIQFGCSIGQNDAPVLKIYISITDDSVSCEEKLRELCHILELEWGKLESVFHNERYDAAGIDLTPNGHCALKIYTYYVPPFDYAHIKQIYQKYQRHESAILDQYLTWIKQIPLRHIGFLYRISADSSISAIKIWARLKRPTPYTHLPVLSLTKKELTDWWKGIQQYLNKVNGGISYVILEDQSVGVYFR